MHTLHANTRTHTAVLLVHTHADTEEACMRIENIKHIKTCIEIEAPLKRSRLTTNLVLICHQLRHPNAGTFYGDVPRR